jgi:predicted ATPase
LVVPDVERLNFKEVRSGVRERAAFVKLKGSSVPVSMSSQGEGVNRLLGIALGLVNARGGMLLVDEIENGIHYSVQPQLWRLILATARDLSVQVFATTHSWDAVEGLRSAIGDPMGDEVVLINVNRRFDRLQATIFDQDELKLATEPSRIEVR